MNCFTLWKFILNKTPENALRVLRSFAPDKWQMSVDGVPATILNVSFKVAETLKQKKLVVEIEYRAGSVSKLVAATRMKNDGSDELSINGVAMLDVSYDFDAHIRNIEIEMRYGDPADAKAHLIVLSNTFVG